MKILFKLYWLLLLLPPIVSVSQTPARGKEGAVSCCSLAFAYSDAPDRPVLEFVAKVVNRNMNKYSVSNQKCSNKIKYEPGNYHVIVNTFPQTERNIVLDFTETIILLPQPGFVKFDCSEETTCLILYKLEENNFVAFDTLHLKDIKAQSLRIQPGNYQVHYRKCEGDQSCPEKVTSFYIKTNKEKTVKLK